MLPSYSTTPSFSSLPNTSSSMSAGAGKGMDPLSLFMMLASLGTGFAGASATANAQKQQNQLSAKQFEESRGDTQSQQIADFLNGILNRQVQQGALGLQSTQMDPYAHAKDLNSANVRRSFGMGGAQQGAPIDLSALNPANLNKSADNFYSQASVAQPNVQTANPAGQSAQNTFNAGNADLKAQIMQYLLKIGKTTNPTGNPQYEPLFATA